MKKRTIKISFYDWCINNNRDDLLNRWDYELNNCNPNEISYGSKNKYYFKCSRNLHKSELHQIGTITMNKTKVICSKCNSFAQYLIDNFGEDALEKYWDDDKNAVDPWEISHGSSRLKVWIKCQKKVYHDSYLIVCESFIKGGRCPYCSSKKIHPKESFAQYNIDNTDYNFLEKYWSNKNTLDPFTISPFSNTIHVWIKCQEKEYHEDYLIACRLFSIGIRCPYCAGRKVNYYDSLGYLYPEVLEIWSDKNDKSPFEYPPRSRQIVWWKCKDNIHEDYKRDICNSTPYCFRCPECARERNESYFQEKVRKYIGEKYNYKLNHEYNCSIVPQSPKKRGSRGAMPFDNEVIELNLIIEVHGLQHYQLTGYAINNAKRNNTTPEYEFHYQKLKDRYKRFIAHHRGYFYLEIPYWTEQDESYKLLIDNKINEICLSKNFKEAV